MMRSIFLAVTFAAIAVFATAEPPTLPSPRLLPKTKSTPAASTKLKSELEEFISERDKFNGSDDPKEAAIKSERILLRAQLLEVIKKLNDRPTVLALPTNQAKTPETPVRPAMKFEEVGKSVNPLREGLNLFRSNQLDAAYAKFANIETENLSREDRAFVQYMTACCLRRKGRYPDAMNLYREVADTKDNEFLTECAIWQIGVLKSTQELETQLEQLRQRKKSAGK